MWGQGTASPSTGVGGGVASLASLTIRVSYAFAGERGVYDVPIAVAF